jgi:hypothetical protein
MNEVTPITLLRQSVMISRGLESATGMLLAHPVMLVRSTSLLDEQLISYKLPS